MTRHWPSDRVGKAKKEQREKIMHLEKITVELCEVLRSMPEVGNWRIERLSEMVQSIKDENGWI